MLYYTIDHFLPFTCDWISHGFLTCFDFVHVDAFATAVEASLATATDLGQGLQICLNPTYLG